MKLFKPLKIKVKRFCKDNPLPTINPDGDYIDVRAAETVEFDAPYTRKVMKSDNEFRFETVFDTALIRLGIGMELPDGMYAKLVSRSKTGMGFGISLINGYGVIDHVFNGNKDEWGFPAVAWRNTTVKGPSVVQLTDSEGKGLYYEDGTPIMKSVPGERIAQFEICLSQHATFWQKLRWLLSDGIEIVEVEELGKRNRGGGCIRVAEGKE